MLELQTTIKGSRVEPDGGKPRARRQHVRVGLQKMIFDGHWPAGARLIQQEVAAQFGTSVGVVREVLLELANAGLVEVEENHGSL